MGCCYPEPSLPPLLPSHNPKETKPNNNKRRIAYHGNNNVQPKEDWWHFCTIDPCCTSREGWALWK